MEDNETTDRRQFKKGERIFLTVSIIVPILALLVYGWWARMNANPDIAIPTPVLPHPNAYDYYKRAGFLSAEGMLATRDLKMQIKALGHPMTDVERAAQIKRNDPAIAELHKGFAYPFQSPPVRSFNDTFPEYAKYRSFARVLAAKSDFEAKQGNYSAASQSALDAIRLGSDIPRGGPLISRLVGQALETIGRRPLWKIADTLSAADAKTALRKLETIQANRQSFAATMTEEKWAIVAGSDELFRKNNLLEIGRLLSAEASSSTTTPSSTSVSLPSPSELRMSLALITKTKRRILTDLITNMNENIYSSDKPYATISKKRVLSTYSDPIMAVLLPTFDGARFKDVQNRTETALLMTKLALSAYHAEQKAYPQTLDDLVAKGYLKQLPQDDFAVSGSCKYRKAASGDRYMLYSVGPDGKDDGGKPIVGKTWPTGLFELRTEASGDYVVGANLGKYP